MSVGKNPFTITKTHNFLIRPKQFLPEKKKKSCLKVLEQIYFVVIT